MELFDRRDGISGVVALGNNTVSDCFVLSFLSEEFEM